MARNLARFDPFADRRLERYALDDSMIVGSRA